MKTVWERIVQACAEHDPPVEPGSELSRIAGISPQAVTQWQDNPNVDLKGKVLAKLADGLGVEAAWIMFGKPPMRPTGKLPGHAIVKFYRDGHVGAGGPVVNDPEYSRIGGISFLESSLSSHRMQSENCSAIRVSGQSMFPRLRDGDTVLYDETDCKKIINGAIYVIEHPLEGALVKRLFREIDGRIRIVSDNPDPRFADEWITDDTYGFRIVGRVRWIGSWED